MRIPALAVRHKLVDDFLVVGSRRRSGCIKPVETGVRCGIIAIVGPWGWGSVVAPDALLDAIDIDDKRQLVGVDHGDGRNDFCV